MAPNSTRHIALSQAGRVHSARTLGSVAREHRTLPHVRLAVPAPRSVATQETLSRHGDLQALSHIGPSVATPFCPYCLTPCRDTKFFIPTQGESSLSP